MENEIKENDINILNEENRPKYYTDAHRKAQQKYREKNRDDYNKSQLELYNKSKQNEEWRIRYNERQRKYNAEYRERIKKELMNNPDYVVRGRGRPKKTIT